MNNQNYAVVPLFSSPVFESGEQFEISKSFLDFIKNVEVTACSPENKEHRNSVNSYILELKEFADLKKFIVKQLAIYVYEVLKITTAHNFYITQSWLNFNERGEDHHQHWHQNSLISGIFYIAGDFCPTAVLSREGDPPFGKNWAFELEEFNVYNSGKWTFENKKNSLLIFPSTVEHYVEAYKGFDTRITLSFNTFVKGNLGLGPNKNELIL